MITRRRLPAIALMGTLLASLVLTAVAPIASAAPFTNGSFETGLNPPVANGNTNLVAPNTTSMPPWTVSAGTVDWIDNGYWQAKAGLRSLDMSGTSPGAVRQTFDTTPGATYTVTFWMSGNPLGGPAVKTMTVAGGNSPAANFSYDIGAAANTRTEMRYAAKTYSFTGACDATTSTLVFTSTIAGNFGPVLDDVKVNLATSQPANPCPPASLCVVKFNDIDRNGEQGGGELILTGWTFTIRDANGVDVGTIGTAPGLGLCKEVLPGTYTVTEEPQSGWTPTTPGGATQTVTVVSGQTTTVTFGNHQDPRGRLCVVKFNDVDGDGKQGNEPVLFGWVFTIKDANGNVVGTITTRDVANCIDLPAGTYTVTETLPAGSGWTPTTPGGVTQTVTIVAGQTTTVTFGNRQRERICVTKFNDLNGDGVRAGEPLLSGWAFTVVDTSSNAVVGTLVSGTPRNCIDVKAGTYKVTETLQPGWHATTPGGVTQIVTVALGQTVNVTFGNHRCCLTFTFLGGKVDNFSLANGATAEPVTPPVITATPAYFDATKSNLAFAHRFVLGTGNCIQSATLTMKIKTLTADNGSVNDTLNIKVPGSTASWGKPISAIAPAGPWIPTTVKTVVFNLGAMPSGGGSTNLIPALNAGRTLDIAVQDDTKVDYIKVVVVFCECAPK